MSELRYGMEFTHPGWLAALVAVPWVVWYFRRSLVDFARWQRAISTGVRVAIVLLLVLALAGLTLLRPTARQFVIVAIDQSLSVGGESVVVDVNAPKKNSAADRFLDELLAAKVIGSEDRVAFVPFGARPGAVSTEKSCQLLAASGELTGFTSRNSQLATLRSLMAPTSPQRSKRRRQPCRRIMCLGLCC